jgi:P4 family phage/plasmid primase-like protien
MNLPSSPPPFVDGETLLQTYLNLTVEKPSKNGHVNGASTGKASPSGKKALKQECEAVASAPEGQRNDQLNVSALKLGGLVAGGELGREEVEDGLYRAAVDAGLEESEIMPTIRSGMGRGETDPRSAPEVEVYPGFEAETPPGLWLEQEAIDLLKYRSEDGGILDCWLEHFAHNWLFVVGYDEWFQWAGTHWRKDESQQIAKEIQELTDAINKAARSRLAELPPKEGKDDPNVDERNALNAKIGATKRSAARINSVEKMAQSQRAIPSAILDRGNVMNLLNGTLDLDTRTLHPHKKDDHLTYCEAYEYDRLAPCPRWKQFLAEVLGDYDNRNEWITDIELVDLFQEAIGYALTNQTHHETMIWMSGEGGNGKTVALSVLQHLLGSLSLNVDFQAIGLPGNYDLAEIQGKRVIFSTESERGGKTAESTIKRVVSGERINARPIYGSPFQFDSMAKIFWAMNDRPVIRDTGNSIWRRLKLIPFNRYFKAGSRDEHLLDKLLAELPGILNWALDGLEILNARGRFPDSKAVDQAIEEYRLESNPVAQWLAEATKPDPYNPTLASTLYGSYKTWAESNGRTQMNSTNFGRELGRLRVEKRRLIPGMAYLISFK